MHVDDRRDFAQLIVQTPHPPPPAITRSPIIGEKAIVVSRNPTPRFQEVASINPPQLVMWGESMARVHPLGVDVSKGQSGSPVFAAIDGALIGIVVCCSKGNKLGYMLGAATFQECD